MPCDRTQWLTRVKSVEREYRATRFATDLLLDRLSRDPGALARDLRVRDVDTASDRLESTYIVRLFAEFETSLRAFWSASRAKDPPAQTINLLNSVAARQDMPDDWTRDAHSVREYRNALVHEREEEVPPIPIERARGNLCRFLSRLPLNW